MYTCKIEFENYSGAEVLELLIAADQLGIESLYEYMMKYFIENYEDYIKENPVKILQLIYANENFKELKKIYLEKFYEYSEKLFESSEFKSLEKPILLEILKRDDFSVDEIVIGKMFLNGDYQDIQKSIIMILKVGHHKTLLIWATQQRILFL